MRRLLDPLYGAITAEFAATGLFLVQFGQWIARDGVERIRRHIETALSGGTRRG